VDRQLETLAENLNSIVSAFAGGAQGATQAADPVSSLGALLQYLTDLADAYPAVKGMPDYAGALATAQGLNQQVASLGSQMLVTAQLETSRADWRAVAGSEKPLAGRRA